MGPRGRGHVLSLFLPTLEGLSPVVRAHLGRDQGPPLFDWHPQIFTHLQSVYLYLTCMGPAPRPCRPEYLLSIRPKLPDSPGPMKPRSL